MWMNMFRLLSKDPELVFDHVAGYAALAKAEIGAARTRVVARLVAAILALMFATSLCVVFAVGAMLVLGGVVAYSPIQLVVPGVLLLLLSIAALVASRRSSSNFGATLERELRADFYALTRR